MEATIVNTNNEVQTISLKEKINLAARNWVKPTPKAKGRRSKFEDHLDTIRYLRSCRHMSYMEICEFFNQNGLECSYANLMLFAKKKNIGGIRNQDLRKKNVPANPVNSIQEVH